MVVSNLETSIVVCTLNRPLGIQHLLESITQQTRQPKKVIIVDQSKTDDTQKLVEKIQKESSFEIKYLHPEFKSLTKARNLGLSYVETPLVTFLDDDIEIGRDYLEKVFLFFEQKKGVLIGGFPWLKDQNKIETTGLLWTLYRKFFGMGYPDNTWSVLPSMECTFNPQDTGQIQTEYISGSNFSLFAAIAKKIQFDEKLKEYALSEDLDFSFAVSKQNPQQVWFDLSLPVIHLVSPIERLGNERLIKMRVCHQYYLFNKHWNKTFSNKAYFIWSRLGFNFIYGLQYRSIAMIWKTMKLEVQALRNLNKIMRGDFFY